MRPRKYPAKIKIFLLSVIIITLCIIAVVFFNYRRLLNHPEAFISSVPGEANLSIGEIHQTATRNGIKEWMLDAASAHYMDGSKQVVLKDLSVTFFLKNQQKIFVTANQGILQTDSKNIEISGNVVVKNEHSRLVTEKLYYKHNGRLLLTKVPVEIVSDSYQLMADKMLLDLNTNQITLEGKVKGAFSEDITL